MNSEILKEVCKSVYKLANHKLSNGEVPLMLGVEGQLALMWESIRRWNHETGASDTARDDRIMDLAVSAMFAVFTQSKKQLSRHLDNMIQDDLVSEPKPSSSAKKKISPMALDDGEVINDPEASSWKIDPDHEEELGESTKD